MRAAASLLRGVETCESLSNRGAAQGRGGFAAGWGSGAHGRAHTSSLDPRTRFRMGRGARHETTACAVAISAAHQVKRVCQNISTFVY